MSERLSRRNFLRLVTETLLLAAAPACTGRVSEANLDILREKGEGVWTKAEMFAVGSQMLKCPGDLVKKNGKWLQGLAEGQYNLKDVSPYLPGELSISTKLTEAVSGSPTLATTQISRLEEEDTYGVEIIINPKVFSASASDASVCLTIGKEIQNIFALSASAKEHRGLVFEGKERTERDFWRFITSKEGRAKKAVIVLADGRAYWEMLDDYRQVLDSLGGNYKNIDPSDQEVLGSWSRLARFALEKGLLIEVDGKWTTNPQLKIPGYTQGNWSEYLFELFKMDTTNYSQQKLSI